MSSSARLLVLLLIAAGLRTTAATHRWLYVDYYDDGNCNTFSTTYHYDPDNENICYWGISYSTANGGFYEDGIADKNYRLSSCTASGFTGTYRHSFTGSSCTGGYTWSAPIV